MIVEKAYPPVTLFQQRTGGFVTPTDFVRDNRRQRAVGYKAVEQYRRDLPQQIGRGHGAMIKGRVDDAVDLALQHHIERGRLQLGVILGIG